MSKVFVMMSGGVDSSVATGLLKEQGYEVVGVFMRCWSLEALEKMGLSTDLYGCFWEDDVQDAGLVAAKLGVPFEVWDFEKEYRERVVDYMVAEYACGRTPNPDVMCNGLIKFGIFYERAIASGADFVATGHYARIVETINSFELKKEVGAEQKKFLAIARGLDASKDQSYFLWRIRREQLLQILFPVGNLLSKSKVREVAKRYGLVTATKPDSQGLCFIGETPLRELLLQTLGKKEGEIVEEFTDRVLGKHPGAFLYTIGQREKLGLSGGPWFVSRTEVETNRVYVVHEQNPKPLYKNKLIINNLNWIAFSGQGQLRCQAQVRYRQAAKACVVKIWDDGRAEVIFEEPVRAATSGQSLVFYDEQILLGGGIIV